jgi:2'-hydroxyisoflavone reductase
VNVLVLGGTRFLGRHIVHEFSRRGHRVAVFHRGQTTCELPDGVEEYHGDRNSDLSAADTGRWDAIVDTSGYRPEQLRRSLALRTKRYLFISTVNVYADVTASGVAEDAPTIEAFDPSDEARSYGGNKAACERLVMARYPGESIVFRPGLIAGTWDPTGRFTYWCLRMLRGGRVLAPGEPNRLVQFVDAADLARFAEHALSNDRTGVFNVVGSGVPTTMARLLDEAARTAAEYGAPPASIVWADAEFLLENGVEEWIELPLWLTEPEYRGIMEMSNAKALAAGLRTRTIAETVRSVLDWAKGTDGQSAAGLSAEREAELLNRL